MRVACWVLALEQTVCWQCLSSHRQTQIRVQGREPEEGVVALVELCIVSISLSIIKRRDLHAAGTGGGAGRPKDCQYSINKNANYSLMHTHTKHAYSHNIFR